MTNRLAGSTSPYLRQHAENPVDWWPWGAEAFAAAVAQDKPILLSVGYSACHWCHVMAHESFADPDIAARMNAGFVNVKVDREERPDVDAVYMDAVQRMTGRGGWPMTVFLTSEGEPFYAGTYFPPTSRPGLIGFPDLLAAVARAWRERRADVVADAGRLAEALRGAAVLPPSSGPLSIDLLDAAAARLASAYDPLYGGFGSAPKFPPHAALRFLLGRYARTGREDLRAILIGTLDGMASGGIRDHIGGGFHRYSVDAAWTVPHFEKMLYDNAQLARAYLCAALQTRERRYEVVVEETLAYLLRELRDPAGAFYAAQDADTAEGEGAFFTWTPEQVRSALPPAEAEAAAAWFGVTSAGNFEGATVLTARRSAHEVAATLGVSTADLERRLLSARERLRVARARRVAPATDTKIVVDWNALAIDALARAGSALDREVFTRAAVRAAEHILALADENGRLAHTWSDGVPGAPGFLEDHAALGGALLTLYEATFDPAWLVRARGLVDAMLDQFGDPTGGFWRSGPRHESLFSRPKDFYDTATPSGNAMAVDALLRLAAFTGETRYADAALDTLRAGQVVMQQAPSAAGALLAALDDHLSGMRAVVIVGTEAAALLRVVRSRCLPGTVVACAPGGRGADGSVGLLAGRHPVGGQATAYVCRGSVCDAPTTDPERLRKQLEEVAPTVTS